MAAPPPPISPDIAPRYRSGTDSVPMVWVDATTPPTNTPCTRRSTMNRTGASRPTEPCVGSRANAAVARPTPTTATIIARRRPLVSAMCPKRAEPTGRMSSVTAKEAYVAASDSVGLSLGKNSGAIVGATNSRMNRSNRSSDQPNVEARIATTPCRPTTCGPPAVTAGPVVTSGGFRSADKAVPPAKRNGFRRKTLSVPLSDVKGCAIGPGYRSHR